MYGKSDQKHIVNLDYLVELSKGNTKFVNEMIKIFLDENPSEISMLEKGMKENNFDLVRNSAHKLRSTVPFIGIDKIIENDISELERLATNNSDTKNIEVFTQDPSIKKVSITTEDTSLKQKMEAHFEKIKDTCTMARSELSNFKV